jgi:hypothetical protein
LFNVGPAVYSHGPQVLCQCVHKHDCRNTP